MMKCYWFLFIGILFAPGMVARMIPARYGINFLYVLPVVIVVFAIPVFIFLYKASLEFGGVSYARRNLLIGIVLSLLGGIGIFLWPPLVNAQITKGRNEKKAARGGPRR